jgi:hypothetical protein
MSTEHIVGLLIEERDRLEAAIAALQGPSSAPAGIYEDPTMPDWVKPKAKVAPAPEKKGFSAATRRRMAEGQKRRWAAINAAKAEPVAPKISETLAAIIAPPEDAEFKSAMSAAIKASSAKRKKATAAVAAKPTVVTAKAPLPPKKKAATAKSAAFSKKMSETMRRHGRNGRRRRKSNRQLGGQSALSMIPAPDINRPANPRRLAPLNHFAPDRAIPSVPGDAESVHRRHPAC